MNGFNPRELGARTQRLLDGQFGGDIAAAARAIGIDETALRDIVEHRADRLRFDILGAIVRRLGVDACWLLTGEYDADAHRRQLEQSEDGRGENDFVSRALERCYRPTLLDPPRGTTSGRE